MSAQNKRYGSGISTVGIKDSLQEPFSTAPIREFEFYLLCHVVDGEGYLFFYDTKAEYHLQKSSVVIITPGTPHIIGSCSPEYKVDYIFFAGDEINRLADAGLVKNCVMTWNIHHRMLDIEKLQKILSPTVHFKIQQLLLSLLLDIHANLSYRNKDLLLVKLIDEITANLEKAWTVDDMARFCKYSTAQLRRCFVKYIGMLPKNYVDEIKMQKAAELLVADVRIDEICRRIGYPDRFYFTRRFKEYYDMPPGKFREKFISSQTELPEDVQ